MNYLSLLSAEEEKQRQNPHIYIQGDSDSDVSIKYDEGSNLEHAQNQLRIEGMLLKQKEVRQIRAKEKQLRERLEARIAELEKANLELAKAKTKKRKASQDEPNEVIDLTKAKPRKIVKVRRKFSSSSIAPTATSTPRYVIASSESEPDAGKGAKNATSKTIISDTSSSDSDADGDGKTGAAANNNVKEDGPPRHKDHRDLGPHPLY